MEGLDLQKSAKEFADTSQLGEVLVGQKQVYGKHRSRFPGCQQKSTRHGRIPDF